MHQEHANQTTERSSLFPARRWGVLVVACGLILVSTLQLAYRFTLPTDGWAVLSSDDLDQWCYKLRQMRNKDDRAAVMAARRAETQAFLDKPTYWRDVIEQAVHLAALRVIEDILGERLRGPGQSVEQLQTKLPQG